MGLILLGKVSKDTISFLSLTESDGSSWFFADYSEASYPKGFEFGSLIDVNQQKHKLTCKLKNVTQQYGKYMDEIPKGWKTIVEIELTPAIEILLNKLEVFDSWEKTAKKIQLIE